MTRTIRTAIGSTCSIPGHLKENLRQIRLMAEQAQRNDCHLLLTPEMSATGYGEYPEVLDLAEEPGEGRVYQALADISRRTGIVVTAGYVEKNGRRRHIAHYAVYPDGRFVSQRKHRATPSEQPLEPAVELYYDETEEIGHVPFGAERFRVFSVKGVVCAIVICADYGMKNLPDFLDREGVDLMMLPVGAGGNREDRISTKELETSEGIAKYRDILKRNSLPQAWVIESIRHRRAILAVNMNGYDGVRRFHGGSGSIVSAQGQIVAYLPDSPILEHQKPGFVCAELHFDSKPN